MTTASALTDDYRVLREGCGLLDRSERGKLALTGAGAKEFLQGQVSNDVEALAAGEGCYAAFLTPKGKMLGDLRVLDTGSELLLDTERVALQELFNMIRRFSVGYDVELHKRTLVCGLLSLIGPGADEVVGAGRGNYRSPTDTENSHVAGRIGETDVRLVRIDGGLDLLCDSQDVATLRDTLCDAGAIPVSEDAAECLRIEHGRPRYGIDLDDTVIPQEAGIE